MLFVMYLTMITQVEGVRSYWFAVWSMFLNAKWAHIGRSSVRRTRMSFSALVADAFPVQGMEHQSIVAVAVASCCDVTLPYLEPGSRAHA